jgi:hypothetical protein
MVDVECQYDVERGPFARSAVERRRAADGLGAILEAEQPRALSGIGAALAIVSVRSDPRYIGFSLRTDAPVAAP